MKDVPTSRRGPAALAALVAALLLALAAEAFYLLDDDQATPSAARPVVVDRLGYQPAVDAAAEAVTRAGSYSFESYADDVDAATALMTDTFAEMYRDTAQQITDDVTGGKLVVEVAVVDQGIVQATAQQATVLVFFDQRVTKAGAQTSYSPLRALVTMQRVGDAWLASDLQTR